MKIQDLTGYTFGRLTVLGRAPRTSPLSYYYCLCSCGNVTCVQSGALKNGHTTSCGCRHREIMVEVGKSTKGCTYPPPGNKLPPGEKLAKDILRDIKRRAKTKQLECSLTWQEVDGLIHQPCHYCKTPAGNRKKGTEYQGLDRVDSRLGYTLDNVVPCCHPCNRKKSDKPVERFIAQMNN